MTDKKTSKARNTRISQAPEPPKTIRGAGSTMSSKRPDWSFWNKLPALSINECVMLLINVEPKTYLNDPKKQQYDRVCRLVRSFQAVGELPSYDANVSPSEFIAWAESNDEEPPDEWKPQNTVVSESGTAPTHSAPQRHYDELVRAAIEMAENGRPPRDIANDLIPYRRENSERFPACCDKCIENNSIARSARKIGDALKDRRYIAVLDKSD